MKLTKEQIKRVEQAISETIRFIEKEEKYSLELQNKELLEWYKKHLEKLTKMLEA